MDLESVKQQIRIIDQEISDLTQQFEKISDELEELQEAMLGAAKIQEEFDNFVISMKSSKDNSICEGILKSFSSFLSKANDLLTGDDYWKAKDDVDEISHIVSQRVNSRSEDLELCDKEIKKLKQQREDLILEYKSLVLNVGEGSANI